MDFHHLQRVSSRRSIFFFGLSVITTICIIPVLEATTRDSGGSYYTELWILSMIFLLALALSQVVQVYQAMRLIIG